MILSSLRIQWISEQKGYGLFATKFIPKGSITFVQDALDLVVSLEQFVASPPHLKKIIDRYSYETADSNRVISWDLGKYMNHCCFANTLTTGYGFEIAVRDIEPNEEVTDDYRIFTTNHPMQIQCARLDCGKLSDPVRYWNDSVKSALASIFSVPQELETYVDSGTLANVRAYLMGEQDYVPVETQSPKIARAFSTNVSIFQEFSPASESHG